MSDLQNENAPSNGAPQAAPPQPARSPAAPAQPAWRASPALDLYESDNELLVLLNVPGASPESIDVQVLGNQLHVRAEQAATAAYTDVARVAFERHFELPAEVDANSAAAELRDGVLEVRLRKSASARRVKIPVSAN
jgi:HSP20 family molecular chaperone IbpA